VTIRSSTARNKVIPGDELLDLDNLYGSKLPKSPSTPKKIFEFELWLNDSSSLTVFVLKYESKK